MYNYYYVYHNSDFQKKLFHSPVEKYTLILYISTITIIPRRRANKLHVHVNLYRVNGTKICDQNNVLTHDCTIWQSYINIIIDF